MLMAPHLSFAASLWNQGPIDGHDLAALDTAASIGTSLSMGISADPSTELWVSTMYRDLGQLNLGRTFESLHAIPGGTGRIGAQGKLKSTGLHLFESIKPEEHPDGRIGHTNIELEMSRDIQPDSLSRVYDVKQHVRMASGPISGLSAGRAIATILEWLESGGGKTALHQSWPQTMKSIEQGADVSVQQTNAICGTTPCVEQEWDIRLSHNELVEQGRLDLAAAVEDMAGIFSISATLFGEGSAQLGEVSINSDPLRVNLKWRTSDGVIVGRNTKGTEWVEWNPINSSQRFIVRLKVQASFQGFHLETKDLYATLHSICGENRCELVAQINEPPTIRFSGLDPVRSALVHLVEDVWGLSRHANEFGRVLATGPDGEGSTVSFGVYRARNTGWIVQEEAICALPDNELIRFAFALVGGILPTPNVVFEAADFSGEIISSMVADYQSNRAAMAATIN
jgi:hypothetical protein